MSQVFVGTTLGAGEFGSMDELWPINGIWLVPLATEATAELGVVAVLLRVKVIRVAGPGLRVAAAASPFTLAFLWRPLRSHGVLGSILAGLTQALCWSLAGEGRLGAVGSFGREFSNTGPAGGAAGFVLLTGGCAGRAGLAGWFLLLNQPFLADSYF